MRLKMYIPPLFFAVSKMARSWLCYYVSDVSLASTLLQGVRKFLSENVLSSEVT